MRIPRSRGRSISTSQSASRSGTTHFSPPSAYSKSYEVATRFSPLPIFLYIFHNFIRNMHTKKPRICRISTNPGLSSKPMDSFFFFGVPRTLGTLSFIYKELLSLIRSRRGHLRTPKATEKLRIFARVAPAQKIYTYSVIFFLKYYVICSKIISTKENTLRRRKQ